MRSSYADFDDVDEDETVTEDLAARLNGNLTKLPIPQLSNHEQIHLANIIECVATAEKYRRSMDDNAMRYLLFFRQHMLRKTQVPRIGFNITWREIVWAFHSGSQDILVDLVSKQFQGKILWMHARESGMFMWMTDLTALVSHRTRPHTSKAEICCRECNLRSLLATNIPKRTKKTPSTAAFIT